MTMITVSGLDGAGKSSLVDWLRAEFEARDRRVTVLHQNDHVGVFAIARWIRDRLRGWSPPADAAPRMTPRPTRLGRLRDDIVWSVPLRRALYPIDLLIFATYRAFVEWFGGRILLMDRYFYDTIVDLAARRGSRREFRLLRLTPIPDLAVLLDVEPEQAFERKGEYSVEYLERRAEAYRALFPLVPSALRVPAASRDVVQAAVASALPERVR